MTPPQSKKRYAEVLFHRGFFTIQSMEHLGCAVQAVAPVTLIGNPYLQMELMPKGDPTDHIGPLWVTPGQCRFLLGLFNDDLHASDRRVEGESFGS